MLDEGGATINPLEGERLQLRRLSGNIVVNQQVLVDSENVRLPR